MASWISLLDIVYPVGALYFSTSSTSPSSIVGGTWTAIEAGRFICAAGTNYAALSMGGKASVALTEAEMPSHQHNFDSLSRYAISGSGHAAVGSDDYSEYGDVWHKNQYHTSEVGSGDAHENRPPYIAVYIWRRTA